MPSSDLQSRCDLPRGVLEALGFRDDERAPAGAQRLVAA
jgi:hypothetical protein